MATNGKVKSNPLNKPSQNPGLFCVRIAIFRACFLRASGRNRPYWPGAATSGV